MGVVHITDRAQNRIRREIRAVGVILSIQEIDLNSQGLRQALIDLGWTPPKETP